MMRAPCIPVPSLTIEAQPVHGSAHLTGVLNALRGVDSNLCDACLGVALSHVNLLHALVVVRRL